MEEHSCQEMSLLEPIPKDYRSGFVALIGRPNVGKSTLVNRLVGEKVAITSPVAQTTRNRLRAILTTPSAQLVMVDTPGIHKPHHLLGERLVQSARMTIGEVDVVLLLFEACHPPGKGDSFIIKLLSQQKLPVLVALNKSDLILEEDYLEREEAYRSLFEGSGWPIYRCSALNGEGCGVLIHALASHLPIGPRLYPSETVSDQPEKVLLAELIRVRLGYKYHWAVADYLQRAARHIASTTDVEQAYAVGQAAVEMALQGENSVMAAIVRTNDNPYAWQVGKVQLAKVANVEKKLPRDYINTDGFGITDKCRAYLSPLILGESYPPYTDGLPNYATLKNLPVRRKLHSDFSF